MDDVIVVSLPVTAPTSKARVKRIRSGYQAEPLAVRQRPFSADDYVEWQISYYTKDNAMPTAMADLQFSKEREVFYPCELAFLVHEAKSLRFISEEEFKNLRQIAGENMDSGVEGEEEIIERLDESSACPMLAEHGFEKHVRTMPLYKKHDLNNNYFVEIHLSPKQRAIGNQAMIYLCVPIRFCTDRNGNSLIGRPADKKEFVRYQITRDNSSLISDVVIAFLFASEKHRQDLNTILGLIG